MVYAYYLSSKTTEQPTSIVIRQNWHNPKGWIETPSGNAIKLVSGENHAKQRNN